MKQKFLLLLLTILLLGGQALDAQTRRPIDAEHPMWLIHVDVWNKADPQKIIDLIPTDVKPYVVMNLSLSCSYDTARAVYKMPQNAVRTFRSWATVCQQNNMFFTCQYASGGHSHLMDNDDETLEYFFKTYPNFLGWNFAEQFWGFNEAGDPSSVSDVTRIALFARLVEMSHRYGGFLTVSFCGNIWSHHLNPVGMMKRNADLLAACQQYPEAILWLYKYTTSSCFYNNESVTFAPFFSGLAKNYGVRYDNCGYNGALESLLGKDHGKKYPVAAGIGTVMEQTCVNGGAVWDGPELIWTEDFQNLANSTVNGYSRRNWGTYKGFDNAWIDMFRKIIDGTLYIPTREEVVNKTKIVAINNVSSGSDEEKYAAWGDLYDGLYKVDDPFNKGDGQWMNNYAYLKGTGRYGTIPVTAWLDSLAKTVPTKVLKSSRTSTWANQTAKVNAFKNAYPEVSTGDMYVNRYRNQLITYTPYTYLNKKKNSTAKIPLQYNTCDSLYLDWGLFSSGAIREYSDSIVFYLNNHRNDTLTAKVDEITIVGATTEPTFIYKKRQACVAQITPSWDAETHRFVLQVKHNGPIDVKIMASGAATDRLTDALPIVALTAPAQPGDYYGPITIEAEDMDFKNVASNVTSPYDWYKNTFGHAGNGFVDMGSNKQGALTHQFKCKQAGNYYFSIRYTSPNMSGNIEVTVNGSKKTVQLEKTALNEWRYTSDLFSLKSGKNGVTIVNTGGVTCYIDNYTMRPSDMALPRYAVNIHQQEHGTVTVNADSLTEGEKVILTVETEPGYTLTGWNIIHPNVNSNKGFEVGEDNTFMMIDDNVTLEPVYKDNSIVYTLDFDAMTSGNIPNGWVCTQENSEEHSFPNSYGSGARTMSGFTGYQGKALYWREVSAEYGKQEGYKLYLEPGKYTLSFAMAAWKSTPAFRANITTPTGTKLATSANISATPNANGSTSANLSGTSVKTLDFSITKAANYLISFTNCDAVSGLDEFLLVACSLKRIPDPNGLEELESESCDCDIEIYNLSGQRTRQYQEGFNIMRDNDGKMRKIVR